MRKISDRNKVREIRLQVVVDKNLLDKLEYDCVRYGYDNFGRKGHSRMIYRILSDYYGK